MSKMCGVVRAKTHRWWMAIRTSVVRSSHLRLRVILLIIIIDSHTRETRQARHFKVVTDLEGWRSIRVALWLRRSDPRASESRQHCGLLVHRTGRMSLTVNHQHRSYPLSPRRQTQHEVYRRLGGTLRERTWPTTCSGTMHGGADCVSCGDLAFRLLAIFRSMSKRTDMLRSPYSVRTRT